MRLLENAVLFTRRRKITTIFCCLSWFISAGIQAQPKQYRFSQIDFSAGLSHNQVNCIYKDAKGFMWFGTMGGLNRYDGYQFKIFRHNQRDSTSLIDDYINQLFEGPGKSIWVLTRSGLNIYDPRTEQFNRYPDQWLKAAGLPTANPLKILQLNGAYLFIYPSYGIYKYIPGAPAQQVYTFSRKAAQVSDVKKDTHDNLWLLYNDNLVEKLDTRQYAITLSCNALQREKGPVVNTLFLDGQDELWLYAKGALSGVYYYRPLTGQWKHFSKEAPTGRLNNNLVNEIIQDNDRKIWIATDHGGINVVDKSTGAVTYLTNRAEDNASIAQNSINTLFKDKLGIIWAGTYKKGISYYQDNMLRFPLYRHQPTDPNSLQYDDVNCFAEDVNENIWIGTNGGGLIYFDRRNNRFIQYRHQSNNAGSLSNDVIVSLCIDHAQKLWIGTYFGGLDCFDGKKFVHYRHNDSVASSLSDDRVWEIYEDPDLNLWVGTLIGGLNRMGPSRNGFTHYRASPETIKSDYICALVEDRQRNLWIGTSNGLDILQRATGRFIHYGKENRLSNENVIAILHDHKTNTWVATRDGLNMLPAGGTHFISFGKENGLPDNNILNLLEDREHHLWVSTPNGIARINPVMDKNGNWTIRCSNYDERDGLQGREFNENASLCTRKGELLFGGANGFNLFGPSMVHGNTLVPPVVFTDFQVFNKSVEIGEKSGNHIILPASVSETGEVTLHYNENVFSVSFAALGFYNTEKNKYRYRLEGFDNDWLTVDSKLRKATYTNLDPGTYRLRVKVSNDEGVWNEDGVALSIHILPPFWKTPLAYLLYLILVLLLLYLARRMVIRRAQLRFALAQERREAQQLHELDLMKIRFFTNVSHEFRTPLSLILTPLDKIIRNTPEQGQKKQLQLVHRNARRLLNLVNQLLDFRKMEVQELRLNTTRGNITAFIKEVAYSFIDIADKKAIRFEYTSNTEDFFTWFDHDKLERILFNILSNAFKFTPEHGAISVMVQVQRRGAEALLEIKVKDTGIGIPPEKQEKIFERFFQNETPGSIVNQGSGIGLAITKEFVKMQEGSIGVESAPNQGSCFTILLPFTEEAATLPPPPVANTAESRQSLTRQRGKKDPAAKKTLLLVEDNEDFLFYLKDNLKEFFLIEEACNGKEGWQKVLAAHPDIVVTDISMPVMNGIELCKKIKEDARTRQIPVILLTALQGEQQQLEGLQIGAADYMTKPFNFEIMLSRIHNILEQQLTFKKAFTRKVEASSTPVLMESADDKFVRQALSIVEQHLSNPDFSVENMSRELCMSRVAVYKRLFALTGKTPIEFIRSIRMQRAAQLLEKSNLTVAEVAYEVGFNNPKYFSKYFKAAFQVLPSVFLAEKRKEAQEATHE